jgi:hypothetical protein
MEDRFEAFSGASEEEIYALLGMYALPLLQTPEDTLIEARRGVYYGTAPAILGEEFRLPSFAEAGRMFLRKWGVQLAKAVCGNDKLYRDIKQHGFTRLGVSVGIIAANLAQSVQPLAAYRGLLEILGVLIAQTGINAFCALLQDLQSLPETPKKKRASVRRPPAKKK